MALVVPGVKYDPLSLDQTEPKMAGHDVICLHTMAGTFAGTEAMFEKEGFVGTDSHFGLRGDGYLEQWQDLLRQVDANLDGNSYCISIECADKGAPFSAWSGSDVPPFTIEQLDKLVWLLDKLCQPAFHRDCPSSWACHTSGIPRILIPDSKRSRRGIGYHRLGINPWRVSGGVLWSNANGKVCPGDNRIKQIKENIIPRLVVEGDDVTPAEHDAIVRIDQRSTAMYKALRGDEDADQELVQGIQDHFRTVIDEASTESGSDLRAMVMNKSGDALEQYGAAKKSDLEAPAG